jgi:DNA-directed RNA polymerase I, II, and III subunit RPABC2
MSYFDNQYGGDEENDNYEFEVDSNEDDDNETSESEDEEFQGDELSGGAGEDFSDPEDYDDVVEEKGEVDEDVDEDVDDSERSSSRKSKKIPSTQNVIPNDIDDDYDDDDDDDDSDSDGEEYLKKFETSVSENYVMDFHPESILHNYDEILAMTKVIRDSRGIIIDDLHKTIPFLTKYERSRILGQRAKQINSGAYIFIKPPENVIDGYIIAELELKAKKIPFIIRRPLPNGGSEYWKIQDLEDLSFD